MNDMYPVKQLYSFAGFTVSRPKDPIPGDRIDSEFTEHRQAINALYAEHQRLAALAAPPQPPVGADNDEKDAAGWGAYAYDWGQVSWRWAEYMAGPIPSDILATMGITGAHWSSAWWANQSNQWASDAEESAQESAASAASWAETGTYYLGSKSTPPTLDNSGNALLTGALYFDTTRNIMRVWTGSNWQDVATTPAGAIAEAPANGQFFARKDLDWWAVDWSTLLGKPTTFPPTAHIHAVSDVTNLQADLDAKANAVDLTTETTNRTNADTTLQNNINTNTTAISTETTNRINADNTLTNTKVAKSGDTMSGDLVINSRLLLSTTLPSSSLQVGSIIANAPISTVNFVLYNCYFDGSFKALNAGYSARTVIDSGTGVWSLSMGSSVAGNGVATYADIIRTDLAGDVSFLSGTMRQLGGRIISSSAAPACVTVYTGGSVNSAMGMWCDTASRLSFGGTSSGGDPGTLAAYLDVGGNFTIIGGTATKASGTTWANPSDVRIKQDIVDYKIGLDEVTKLRPVAFRYRPETNYPEELLERRQVGFIAQEVETVMPDMVTTAPGQVGDIKLDDLRTLDTNNLVFALCNAVRELSERIQQLESKP
jgi:hypothetical protein